MIGLNRDTSVALTAIVIIAMFISVNIYTENRDTGGEFVRWGDVYCEPAATESGNIYDFQIETLLGYETVSYDAGADDLTGDFVRLNRTLLMGGASVTVTDVDATHLKGLMVPSDVPVNSSALFGIFVNLQDDYSCEILVNGNAAEWDIVGQTAEGVVVGIFFDSSGTKDISVNIKTDRNDYYLGWTVNVI